MIKREGCAMTDFQKFLDEALDKVQLTPAKEVPESEDYDINEEVRAYIKKVFDTVLNEWGFDLVKLDFLYAAAIEPLNGNCRAKVMYDAMDLLRECVGDKLILGVGQEGEVYHGIGRGELNIAGLPVYRDAIGGIGTPTSDEERTKISLETTSLLMIINGYSGKDGLLESGQYALELLRKYNDAKEIEMSFISKKGQEPITF